MSKYLVAALLLIIMVLGTPVLAAESTGTIEGQVINNTHDGAPVASETITVKTYINDSETESKTVETDANGYFSLDGLSTNSGNSYEATINFQGADYTSDRVNFEDKVYKKSVKLIVWDSTASDKDLIIQSAHTVIYPGEGNLQVNQYALIENTSNLTYIGSKQLAPDKKETLRLSIPAGASDLQYGSTLMGCCVIPGDGIISDTMPVNPGTREIVYSYTIPVTSDVYTLDSKFDYPTQSYDLLVPTSGVTVNGTNLAMADPVSLEGQQFNRYSIQNAAAGDSVDIELSGIPQSSRQKLTSWIMMGSGALILMGIMGYVMTRRRQPQPAPLGAAPSAASTSSRQRQLVAEIAQLDTRFENGQLSEDIYTRQRAARKAELLKLMRGARTKGAVRS